MWFAVIGALLIGMSVISASPKRFPSTFAIIYLLFGLSLGDAGLAVISLDPVGDVSNVRLLTECAVIVSLFTAGLKLRLPLAAPEWRVPLLLATLSMSLTIAVTAALGVWVLGLSSGAAVLLGAILAPTDPVLASSVQVYSPEDRDRLRFSLTGEAGLNDGTAFPFVMLGLGLLGLHELGAYGWRWVLVDLLWAVFAGLGIGTLLATSVGKLVIYLREQHEETESLDDFLALGLIGLSYGLAILAHAYGFLAVFAAGLALRRRERWESQGLRVESDRTESPARTDTVSGRMAQAVLDFNEHIERLGELAVVCVVGAMLSPSMFGFQSLTLALLLLLIARPLSILIGVRSKTRNHKFLLAWFGIRGIGSLYYLEYAIERGLPGELADQLSAIVLTTIVVSTVFQGLSAAPLMRRHSGAA